MQEKPMPKNGGRRKSKDRFAWHARYHRDCLVTQADLKLAERGLYTLIIDLCYARRGPLPDDDSWMAKQANININGYRKLKAALLEKNRIVVDAEAGTIYDERAIRELVAAEMFSEGQRDRADKRWSKAKRSRLKVVEGGAAKPEAVGGNPPASPPASPGASQGAESVESQQNQRPDRCSHNTTEYNSQRKRSGPPRRAALPLKSGGASVAPKLDELGPVDRRRILDDLRAKLQGEGGA